MQKTKKTAYRRIVRNTKIMLDTSFFQSDMKGKEQYKAGSHGKDTG
jgi:hypothetical protein